MQPQIIAHRGASYLAPENTLSAFHMAKQLGADGVEFDVQETSDNKLLIHHDYVIDFHTQLSGNIYDMLEGELRELDFGRWKGVDFINEKIPTLAEALAASADFGTIMVELKSNVYPDSDFVSNVINEIKAAGVADRAVIIAFQHGLLAKARSIAPEIKIGALLYGDLTGFFTPPSSIAQYIEQENGAVDEAANDMLEALSGPRALETALDIAENPELYEEENGPITRWVTSQVTMLRASFPGQNLFSILFNLAAQRDPAAYIKTLGFTPDYVSCEHHTAYARPQMVDELRALGVKTAFWTVDTREGMQALRQLEPDAIVTNRADTARKWLEPESEA